MTITAPPTLTPAPGDVPDKYGSNPPAFDLAMHNWLQWWATRTPQEQSMAAWMYEAGQAMQSMQFTRRGEWTPDAFYNKDDRDWVTHGGQAYVCTASHAAGVFSDDLSAGKWVAVDVVQLAYEAAQRTAELAGENGTETIGYRARGVGVITTVKSKLDQSVSINDEFGPCDSGASDATGAVNAVASWLAVRGGGHIVADPGIYKISGSVLIASQLDYFLPGVTFAGSGANAVFQTAWLNGTALEENVSEWGTGTTGNGTHWVARARVYGVKVINCAKAARLHRWNYGSKFEMCDLSGSDRSIHASHSWGQAYVDNLIRGPMQLQDFMDWTRLQGNSFEQVGGLAALILGQDQAAGELTYGGCWTMKIEGNGFHGCGVGIMPRVEIDGLKIHGNHFENSTRHIYQPGALRCESWDVKNNHFAATGGKVLIAIEMNHLRNSEIGKNDWVATGGGSFNKRVILQGTNSFGNRIQVPYSTASGEPDLSLYALTDTASVVQSGGSNNPLLAQPVEEVWSGSGSCTVEKYRAKHKRILGAIPLCVRTTGVNQITVLTTHVDADAWGVSQPVVFNFDVTAAVRSHRLVGVVAGLSVTMWQNQRRDTGTGLPDAGSATVTASVVGSKLQLVISGLYDAVNNCTGFVKAL